MPQPSLELLCNITMFCRWHFIVWPACSLISFRWKSTTNTCNNLTLRPAPATSKLNFWRTNDHFSRSDTAADIIIWSTASSSFGVRRTTSVSKSVHIWGYPCQPAATAATFWYFRRSAAINVDFRTTSSPSFFSIFKSGFWTTTTTTNSIILRGNVRLQKSTVQAN